MKYDFDIPVDRHGTASTKWDNLANRYGRAGLLPMWVADMDFTCPSPVVEAIRHRAEHPIYGYSFPTDSCYEAIQHKLERDFHWQVEKEWIVFSNGVVDGLDVALQSLLQPGDHVLLQEPAFFDFFPLLQHHGVVIDSIPLAEDNGTWRMDAQALEKAYTPRTKALLFCSPHNPTGRVWTPEELAMVAESARRHNCIILSDEIHCDIVFSPHRHTVLASLGPDIRERTLTFMSASKTFNTAGLCTAYAVIPNKTLRDSFLAAQTGRETGTLFGYVALEAAYEHGGSYQRQLIDYLAGNVDTFLQLCREHLPAWNVVRPEGSYLAWVDMRNMGLSPDDLNRFLMQQGHLALKDGRAFGAGGEGFQRFNLACPRDTIRQAVHQAAAALKNL
ncbi:MAG: PatB family C-S lyase [Verrucomicrobiota bacterium]|jgi:cystathionine beta-lyase|nr:PatB family C-S lyase [Verrucomicrobiota bacterium]